MLAFQSTHQIFLWHFQRILSIETWFLPFWVSKSWYFSMFSLSFPPTLTSTGKAILMIIPFRSFLSIKIMSGFLSSVMLPQWTIIFHNTFTSSFSTAPSGTCSYHFSVCSITHFSYKGPTLSYCLLYSFWPNFLHPLTRCCTLSPFSPHNLHRGFSLVLLALQSLSWWPVYCSHNNASVPIFKSLLDNHYQVYPYQLSLAFPWQTVYEFSFHASFVEVIVLPVF